MTCRGCDNEVPPGRGGRPRIWCSDRCRKRTLYSEPCVDCGKPHGGKANRAGGRTSGRYCAECAQRHAVEASQQYGDAVRDEVGALWREGCSLRSIAEILEWTPESVKAYIGAARVRGFAAEFPRRHAVSEAGRRRMSEAGKRARAAEHREAA